MPGGCASFVLHTRETYPALEMNSSFLHCRWDLVYLVFKNRL